MNTLSLDQLRRNLDSAGVPADLVDSALPAIRLLSISGVREHFKRQEGPDGRPWKNLGRPRPDGSSVILRDKGLLLSSVAAKVLPKEVVLTASHPAANVHQYGGTIRPKLAKMLALPMTVEAKRIGSPKQNRFPRPLFILTSKNRKLFLAERGPGGTLTLHYQLRREVTVPARPYLGWSEATLKKIDRLLQDKALDWISKAFLGTSAEIIGDHTPPV